MAEQLKVLFIGLGSIGRRHLANLHTLCEERGIHLGVSALRATDAPLPPETAKLVDRELRALPPGEHFDAAFITGPTHLHGAALADIKGRAGALFIEKPILQHPAESLEALGLGREQRAYVAAPMRWTALYAALKQALGQHPPYAARVICSSYLPNWRPNADYRSVYSAKSAMGGGVTLDLIHEWDYLADLFGLPETCFNLRGKFSHLEIDADDLSVYIARYPGLLCEVHLDYFGRSYRRQAEFFCGEGTLLADFGTGVLTLPGGATEDHSEDPNQRYLREMDWFLGYALGHTTDNPNPPALANRVLRLALGEA